VAKKLGYWSEKGLDVQIDRGYGSGRSAQSTALNEYEFGEASFSVAVNAFEKDLKTVALGARLQRSPLAFFALKGSGILKPKDLEGKVVGIAAGGGNYHLWPAFVKATGIDGEKVKLLFTDPTLEQQVLLEKKVHALSSYLVSTGASIIGQGHQLDTIFYGDYGLEMIDQTFLTQPDRLKKEPQLCRDFVEGALKGLAYAYVNPDKALDVLDEFVPAYAAAPRLRKVTESSQGVNHALGLSPGVEEHGVGWMDPKVVENTIDKVVKYMGLKKPPKPEETYSNQFTGSVRLTPEQWAQVKKYTERFLPRKVFYGGGRGEAVWWGILPSRRPGHLRQARLSPSWRRSAPSGLDSWAPRENGRSGGSSGTISRPKGSSGLGPRRWNTSATDASGPPFGSRRPRPSPSPARGLPSRP
jgi:NitT/TauT family transport system substrate-binding protein